MEYERFNIFPQCAMYSWYPRDCSPLYILMLLFPEDEEFLYIIVRERQFVLIDGVTGCVPEEEEIVLLHIHHP